MADLSGMKTGGGSGGKTDLGGKPAGLEGLVCRECGRTYPLEPGVLVCPDCAKLGKPGFPLRGVLEVLWDYEALRSTGRLAGPWIDVVDILPVAREFFPPIPVGDTPLWRPENLRRLTGFGGLFVKDDGLNPTGSFKDRASYLVAAFARAKGLKKVVVASTGNAASSMAGVGAAAGLEVKIFMPKAAPKAKIVQSLQYGADVTRVEGNYDLAYDASVAYCREHPEVLSRNTAQQPLTIEGKKTVSLELYKQLGGAPDRVYLAAGDGVILAGVYRGFEDLLGLGLITRVPKIVAVQAEGSDAIARAFRDGDFAGPIASRTVADSIAVDVPRNGSHALGKLRAHGGSCVRVSDEEILDAQRLLARTTGLFAEPAGAAAFAGFLKDRPDADRREKIVVLTTGSGLKDIEAALAALDRPERTL